jgi:hypothetical protein
LISSFFFLRQALIVAFSSDISICAYSDMVGKSFYKD